MTLRHMKIFTAVFQYSSITRASEELHLAQPSVSLAVKELEEYYGIRLFERMGRGISPTEAGKEFYGYALHIVSLFDEMEKKIRNWDAIGTLRIGTSITIGTHILPSLVLRCQELLPGLTIKAFVSRSAKVEEGILSNTIDFGMIENYPEHPELCAVPFMQDELCAVVAPSHELAGREKVTLKELAQYPFLMREKGSAGRDILDACFAIRQLSVKPSLESASTQAIVSGVAAGLGVAVLPCLLIEKDLKEGTVIRVPLAHPLKRELNIVYHKSKYLTKNMKLFMQLCMENDLQSSEFQV